MNGCNSDTARDQVLGAILLLGVLFLIQGCAGGVVTGTTYAAGGTATAALAEEREEYKTTLVQDYQEYQALFTASECNPDEYRISPTILESLRETRPTEDGFASVQETLKEVYHNRDLPRRVRAHALYLIALMEAEKEDGSRQKAQDYLQQVKEEFPGTHDCAVNVLLERGREVTEDRGFGSGETDPDAAL